MMVVDGGSNPEQKVFYANNSNSITGLIVGNTYIISYWILNVNNAPASNPLASIQIVKNDASGITVEQTDTCPANNVWTQVKYSFVAVGTWVQFWLLDAQTNPVGNDFALDDIELTAAPLPLSLRYSVLTPVCPGSTAAYVTLYGSGGIAPYTYSLGGSAYSTSNIFPVTAPLINQYASVKDATGAVFTTPATINVAIGANPLSIAPPSATVCAGTATTFTASGGANYIWTASPADATLTTPNNASITVTPTKTTEYTVSVRAFGSPNLIFNPAFELGDVGFITDYTDFSTSPYNSNRIQDAYGIVTNASTFESTFGACVDHTTGTGNMMVCDGSTVSGSRIWCQAVPVTPNTTYTFSYWLESPTNTSLAQIQAQINGVVIGTATAPATTCSWEQVTYTWASGANTTAQICLYDENVQVNGNDFALDDLSLSTTTTCTIQDSAQIIVNAPIIPTFSPIPPICSSTVLAALPTTSTNSITGTWSPALNNTATTTYTFTPIAGQCAASATLTITVNPKVTPTFTAVAPICSGATLAALPTTSTNGITGTWSPALNNTATTTYTFTPTAGQCASTTTLTITVNSPVVPTFTPIPPICSDSSLASLPTISTNDIKGTWSPPLNNAATTTYTFTPNAGQCATTTTLTITITPALTPIFAAIPPICSGTPLAALPTTSTNGITGTWSPDLNNTKTTTYTFTPNMGQCAFSTTLTITVTPATTPTFNPIAPICSGIPLAALPTTSTNGIIGTWSPALNNTATTTYTFTPKVGQCATTTTLTITVTPGTTPTFSPVAAICSGTPLAALPTTSTNGITGTWSPALNNAATTTYTFTPTTGQCATPTTLTITVTPPTTPTFNPIAPICSGTALAALPTISTNGIMGTWSPALNNTATTTYTFTPNAGQCATTTTLTISVNAGTTPTFNPVAPICSGTPLAALPTTSTNGITGTWSPALNNATTTTYTFTPTTGQCATPSTLTITVTPPTTPTFNPIAPICSGAALAALPTTSTNGITGTWLPALNNTVTTTYTFTPNAGQCATTTTLTISVNVGTTPTFNPIAPICSGSILSALPTTSTNGITGTWSPALNNITTTTYTFTPQAGQCATGTTLTITVTPGITPIFSPVAAVCSGTTLAALPTTSTNGITGTWSPPLNNTTTTTYTFTPATGQCATPASATIEVNTAPIFTLGKDTFLCSGESILLNPQMNTFANYLWQNGSNAPTYLVQASGTYYLTASNQCGSFTDSVNIGIGLCKLFMPSAFTPNGDGLNDIFRVKYPFPVNNFEMAVYNRWGQKVFETTNISSGWDGTFNGITQPSGTYVWAISVTDAQNTKQTLNGTVVLIR
jgi:gliding motility-associated-like protein